MFRFRSCKVSYEEFRIYRDQEPDYLDEVGEFGVPIDHEPVNLRIRKKPNQEK